MNDEDDIIAAEFALGLLDDAEAQAVQVRARTDAALSLRIAWWRDQLMPLVREVETDVPANLWSRIEARLPGNDNSKAILQRWRASAIGAMAVAAALFVYVGTRPSPVPVATPAPVTTVAPMIAALSGDKGATVAVSYAEDTGRLTVAPSTLDPGKGDAELWIIPDGGSPVSLGVINAQATLAATVPAAKRALVLPGAVFAITQEVKNGSPDGKPHGPIVASGKIFRT